MKCGQPDMKEKTQNFDCCIKKNCIQKSRWNVTIAEYICVDDLSYQEISQGSTSININYS